MKTTTWYEIYIDMHGGKGTRTVKTADTLRDAVETAFSYKKEHPTEYVYLDRWEYDEHNTPMPVEELDIGLTEEWCPHCDLEVQIRKGILSDCPKCGNKIRPCSSCPDALRGCDWDDAKGCKHFQNNI